MPVGLGIHHVVYHHPPPPPPHMQPEKPITVCLPIDLASSRKHGQWQSYETEFGGAVTIISRQLRLWKYEKHKAHSHNSKPVLCCKSTSPTTILTVILSMRILESTSWVLWPQEWITLHLGEQRKVSKTTPGVPARDKQLSNVLNSPVILYEDKIPYLCKVTVTHVDSICSKLAARNMIYMDLSTWTTRSSDPHFPEVVIQTKWQNVIWWNTIQWNIKKNYWSQVIIVPQVRTLHCQHIY